MMVTSLLVQEHQPTLNQNSVAPGYYCVLFEVTRNMSLSIMNECSDLLKSHEFIGTIGPINVFQGTSNTHLVRTFLPFLYF